MRLAALQIAIVYGVLLAGGICLAQQTVTVKGVTYVGAELIKEYQHSVYISHTAGRGFINKADLTAQQAQELGVSAPQAGSGSAEQSESFVLPDALSVNGVTYEKPVYGSHNEFALQISHDAGVASLRIAELPADVQKGLNYNPEAGAKAEEAHLNSHQDLLARQQAEKRRALEAKQSAAEEAAKEAARTPGIASAQDVKDFWIRSSARNIPRSKMAHDYANRKRDHGQLVDAISSGYFDNEAQRQALEWNISEYQRVGDLERAQSSQQQLADLQEHVRKQEELAQAGAQTQALRDISTKLQGIRQEMRDIEWRSRNW